ncbi:MAG: LytR C-terminal domain-containing protein [Mobiluncus porci]|uniref:LytR family transcriptional regulator n=1 Tax=Mobiluncus porci TaxID=2652278 RepID=A0A7K0K497_9ACTO|nr:MULTISPECIES: LytR C-terminal domain-containing protein [Mobiluncus]MCI6584205.1 LytR C-terminal domain-containing protein [Mobiluncus sp.]MDD7541881.1 LytR C-terminal domain-containing protein [Mobiluncus porci]MDY5749351.1 LytR C-terminal domain-containing protein [Mobiluncus porci]MST50307.1 LytR family transcriptional regulator [Mobiluncus porci]
MSEPENLPALGEMVMGETDSQQSASGRARRRRYMFARQTVLLGWIVLGMALVAVVAIPFATGILTLPFGDSFTLSEEAKAKAPPCAPSGEPVNLKTVKANILNGSSRNGLARETADRLKTFGVKVGTVGNAADSYAGAARITTGKEGLVKAFSLARALPDSDVRVDLVKGSEITVLLGEQFQGALSKEILGGDELGKYPESPENCATLD